MNNLLVLFSKLGSENNLSFSGQEILNNSVIGLDGIRRKLVILDHSDTHRHSSCVIDLSDVKNCSLKKQIGTISAGGLQNKKLEEYIEELSLHFEFSNGKDTVEIPFYKDSVNQVHQLPELERKARHWKTMLSKMLKAPLKKRA